MGMGMMDAVQNFIQQHSWQTDVQTRYIDLVSEIGELGKEITKSTDYGKRELILSEQMTDEMGDCLFSLFALCHAMGIDAQAALDGALDKYERRLPENAAQN